MAKAAGNSDSLDLRPPRPPSTLPTLYWCIESELQLVDAPEEPAWSKAVEDEEWGHAQPPTVFAPADAMNRPRFFMNWLLFSMNCPWFSMNWPWFSVNRPRFSMNRLAFTMKQSAFAAILAPFLENRRRSQQTATG